MSKHVRGFVVAIGLSLFLCLAARADDFYIAVELYRAGGGSENIVPFSENYVSMYPLAGFRSEARRNPVTPDLMRKELMAIYNLSSVSGVFAGSMRWNSSMGDFPSVLMLNQMTFRLDLRPKFLPPDKMRLKVSLSRAKDRAAAKILDTEYTAALDDPVVAGFSYQNQKYFLSIRVSKNAAPAEAAAGAGKRGESVRIPLPVKRVTPENRSGPEAEKSEGEVVLRATVDKDGRVTDVQVMKPLDPESDQAAARALRQWTFETAAETGGPRPVSFAVSFHFWPGAAWGLGSDPQIEAVPPRSGELDRILASCAAYCRRLSAAVLDFVCEEKIDEEIYDYILSHAGSISYASLKRKTERNAYVYDYQMIRKDGAVRENRTLLEENGRKTREAQAPLKTKRFFSYQSIYGPIGFFAADRQPLFDYALGGQTTMNGTKVWIVEVTPKAGRENLPSGKAWVSLDSGQILKIERDAESLEGYGEVLRSYDLARVTPQFVTEHYYETAKNGILFPSKTTFRESIRTQGGRRFQKSRTEISFGNYRFFTVQTEESVLKRRPELP